MSVEALRRVMGFMSEGMDEDLGAAFYELLLRTRLLVPVHRGTPLLLNGPGGQTALPVFLDEPALVRWGGTREASRVCSALEAAQLARHLDAWLVVDMGSSPGGQPVARTGVEALAKGTFPGIERYREQHAFVKELGDGARRGAIGAELIARAPAIRLFTIGDSGIPVTTGPGVYEVRGMNLLSVRGPDGGSYCVGWVMPGGCIAYMPDTRRMVVSVEFLIDAALKHGRGLVIDPYGNTMSIAASRLAELWPAR
jgi:hypothetical protein